MFQDKQSWPAGPAASLPSAGAAYGEPVEHLHFDRRAREWRSHAALRVAQSERVTAGSIQDGGVRQ